MRVDSTKDKEKKKKDKKRQQSILEKEILSIMSKSMKTALDMALDDLLKDWNHIRFFSPMFPNGPNRLHFSCSGLLYPRTRGPFFACFLVEKRHFYII